MDIKYVIGLIVVLLILTIIIYQYSNKYYILKQKFETLQKESFTMLKENTDLLYYNKDVLEDLKNANSNYNILKTKYNNKTKNDNELLEKYAWEYILNNTLSVFRTKAGLPKQLILNPEVKTINLNEEIIIYNLKIKDTKGYQDIDFKDLILKANFFDN